MIKMVNKLFSLIHTEHRDEQVIHPKSLYLLGFQNSKKKGIQPNGNCAAFLRPFLLKNLQF